MQNPDLSSSIKIDDSPYSDNAGSDVNQRIVTIDRKTVALPAKFIRDQKSAVTCALRLNKN